MDLGGSWALFGKGLGRFGPSFGHLWAPFDRFFGVLNRAFFKHGSKMGSKRPSETIWGGFWKVLEGFWVDFGKDLGGFGQDLEGVGGDFPAFLVAFGKVGAGI